MQRSNFLRRGSLWPLWSRSVYALRPLRQSESPKSYAVCEVRGAVARIRLENPLLRTAKYSIADQAQDPLWRGLFNPHLGRLPGNRGISLLPRFWSLSDLGELAPHSGQERLGLYSGPISAFAMSQCVIGHFRASSLACIPGDQPAIV
jgi:hypothetical protein